MVPLADPASAGLVAGLSRMHASCVPCISV